MSNCGKIEPETGTETGNRIEIISTIFKFICTSFVKGWVCDVDITLGIGNGGTKIITTAFGADAYIFGHISYTTIKLTGIRSHKKTICVFIYTE